MPCQKVRINFLSVYFQCIIRKGSLSLFQIYVHDILVLSPAFTRKVGGARI